MCSDDTKSQKGMEDFWQKEEKGWSDGRLLLYILLDFEIVEKLSYLFIFFLFYRIFKSIYDKNESICMQVLLILIDLGLNIM